MNMDAKHELASAILRLSDAREASWDGERYTLSYQQAVAHTKIDCQLAPLIVAMCQSGFCDFAEWADDMMGLATAE